MPLPAEQEWKKGCAELLVLALLEDQPRHGYDIARLIDLRSGGSIRFHAASLYPLLYRLEKRNWIQDVGSRRPISVAAATTVLLPKERAS
jgi:PadR family transcriptional regulator PadR